MTVVPRFVIGAAGLFALAGPAFAQTTLKYQFKEGETRRYEMSSTNKATVKAGGIEYTSLQKQVVETSWHVVSVDDKGNARVKLTFDRVKMSLDNGKDSKEIASDSKHDPDDDMGKAMAAFARALAKLEATFTLTPHGDVKDVKIPSEAVKAMRDVPGAGKSSEAWSEEGVAKLLKESGLSLPGGALDKGAEWKNKMQGVTPFGKIAGEVAYKYEGCAEKDGCMVEKFAMKPNLKVEAPEKKGPVAITVKSYDGEGVAYFDNAAGRLVEVTTTQRVEAEAMADNQTVTQRLEITNSLKLRK